VVDRAPVARHRNQRERQGASKLRLRLPGKANHMTQRDVLVLLRVKQKIHNKRMNLAGKVLIEKAIRSLEEDTR